MCLLSPAVGSSGVQRPEEPCPRSGWTPLPHLAGAGVPGCGRHPPSWCPLPMAPSAPWAPACAQRSRSPAFQSGCLGSGFTCSFFKLSSRCPVLTPEAASTVPHGQGPGQGSRLALCFAPFQAPTRYLAKYLMNEEMNGGLNECRQSCLTGWHASVRASERGVPGAPVCAWLQPQGPLCRPLRLWLSSLGVRWSELQAVRSPGGGGRQRLPAGSGTQTCSGARRTARWVRISLPRPQEQVQRPRGGRAGTDRGQVLRGRLHRHSHPPGRFERCGNGG